MLLEIKPTVCRDESPSKDKGYARPVVTERKADNARSGHYSVFGHALERGVEWNLRIKRSECVLVVVDVQDRLINTIANHEMMVQNIQALVKAAEVLQVPILASEQENLGETVPELKPLLTGLPTRKLSFSGCENVEFMTKLNATQRKTVILCGMETHICIAQTVLDLVPGHYRILVVEDATSSHSLIDRETALRRMEEAGAEITTTEAAIYEMTEKAGTDEFRQVLDIVKKRRRASDSWMGHR